MGDERPNAMNLDLNLGPSPSLDNDPGFITLSNEAVTLDDWIGGQSVNRVRESDRLRFRGRGWTSVWQPGPITPETRNIALELMMNSSSVGGSSLQAGEGSVPSEVKDNEASKARENNANQEGDGLIGKREDEEKGSREEESFFDCNICLELPRDPVVTPCGHLFCWPCIYRWVHVHSDAKECPVCKGEVTIKNMTPIYGRGSSNHELEEDPNLIYGRGSTTHDPGEDPGLKIPTRPHARRIESWRQTFQRNGFPFPMEEMIRRLGSRFDLTRDLVQVYSQNTDNAQNHSSARSNSLLNRILTSRGMRREHNTVVGGDEVVDAEVPQDGIHRHSSLLHRRSNTHRAYTVADLTSALSSSETLVSSYFQYYHVEGNQEQPPAVDDRDSVSSIAAVIRSESQTVDTAAEIDSTVSLSTSSSRRRNDASRVSDVDSGDSRPYRRRRFN
ncbi:hypothetical protein RHGRI_006235 [Rhododendron griersonianum]|uniref:E3 ubiquitin-protein ligase RMA n=1 Tax=Rhododendron griersonianum TaxID=479676 RepID=A0AAV6KSC4_9ERIC|nr:hypothetical protein RHGRI_006235 [Rhododendron griersonianum]